MPNHEHDQDEDELKKPKKSDPVPQTAESDKPPTDPPEGPGGDDRG